MKTQQRVEPISVLIGPKGVIFMLDLFWEKSADLFGKREENAANGSAYELTLKKLFIKMYPIM